jgi:hypothetical protein
MIQQQPFATSMVSTTLGDPVLDLQQPSTAPAAASGRLWEQADQDLKRELQTLRVHVHGLEDRIRALENQTLAAYWLRFVLWIRSFWSWH